MKSYKCEYCNLTNWTNVIVCKRCQMPNPYLPEHEGINNNQFAQEPMHQQFSPEPPQQSNQQPQFARQSQYDQGQTYQNQPFQNNLNQANPNLPPPPNVYGQRAGNTNYPDGFGQNQMYQGKGYQQVIPGEVDIRFSEALDNINSAYKAGKTYCILCGVLFAILGLLFIFAAGSMSNVEGGSGATGIVAIAGIFVIAVMAVVIAIMYGLSRGVRNKSRACAVILLVIFGFGLLVNLFSLLAGAGVAQNGISILIGCIWTYYFALGVKGTFAYHDIVKQYPTLAQS